jgi:hypothetical protein
MQYSGTFHMTDFTCRQEPRSLVFKPKTQFTANGCASPQWKRVSEDESRGGLT